MPTGPQGQKRPASETAAAVQVAKIATGQEQENPPTARKSVVLHFGQQNRPLPHEEEGQMDDAAYVIVQAPAIPWDFQETEDGQWVARSEVLGALLQSATFPELVEDIQQTMAAIFADLDETGDLEQFVKERGWSVQRLIPKSGRVDMPLRFLIRTGPHDTAHALSR